MEKKALISISWNKSIDYVSYQRMIKDLLSRNMTTGNNHSAPYIEYTKMNMRRMLRLDKQVVCSQAIIDAVQSAGSQRWLVITEAWCGDAAQNIPAMVKAASYNPLIEIRFVLRDENPELMDHYLTDGGRGIPILIATNSEGNELFHWGPRPFDAQKIVMDNKFAPKDKQVEYAVMSEKLHSWYHHNKNVRLQEEITELLKSC